MKIEVIEGNERVVVVAPTASAESQMAKSFLRSIELNTPFPTVIFVESVGDEFHFSKSMNEGIRKGFSFSPDYMVLSNDAITTARHQLDLLHTNRWIETAEVRHGIEPSSLSPM